MIIFIILKQKNNLIKNLILNKEYFQVKEDLVKLENVKVNQIKMIIKIMQLKLCKMYQVVQILQKLKLFNKLKVKKIYIQFNIMIVDIDNKNKDIKHMNILQLKWMQYNLILKNNYKKIFKIKENLIMMIFIIH